MGLIENKNEGQDKFVVWDQLFRVLDLREDLTNASGALYEAKLCAPDQWAVTLTGRERALLHTFCNILPKLQRELWLVSYDRSGQRLAT